MKKKAFKLVESGNRTCIQQCQQTLFGEAWVTLLTFTGCRNRCRQIVELLNVCDEISTKLKEANL